MTTRNSPALGGNTKPRAGDPQIGGRRRYNADQLAQAPTHIQQQIADELLARAAKSLRIKR